MASPFPFLSNSNHALQHAAPTRTDSASIRLPSVAQASSDVEFSLKGAAGPARGRRPNKTIGSPQGFGVIRTGVTGPSTATRMNNFSIGATLGRSPRPAQQTPGADQPTGQPSALQVQQARQCPPAQSRAGEFMQRADAPASSVQHGDVDRSAAFAAPALSRRRFKGRSHEDQERSRLPPATLQHLPAPRRGKGFGRLSGCGT